MNAVADTLRAARALIEAPERWTNYELARDADGDACPPFTDRAICWCAVGAVLRFAPYDNDQFLEALWRCTRRYNGLEPDEFRAVEDIGEINDESTHAEVLALFDRAIAAAEAEA